MPDLSPSTVDSDEPEAERIAVAFSRVLRGTGIEVPVGATVTFAHALELVGLRGRAAIYWAGRTTLVKRPEDIDVYDRAFDGFWFGVTHDSDGPLARPVEVVLALDVPDTGDHDEDVACAGSAPPGA